jgi:hypothetical protein
MLTITIIAIVRLKLTQHQEYSSWRAFLSFFPSYNSRRLRDSISLYNNKLLCHLLLLVEVLSYIACTILLQEAAGVCASAGFNPMSLQVVQPSAPCRDLLISYYVLYVSGSRKVSDWLSRSSWKHHMTADPKAPGRYRHDLIGALRKHLFCLPSSIIIEQGEEFTSHSGPQPSQEAEGSSGAHFQAVIGQVSQQVCFVLAMSMAVWQWGYILPRSLATRLLPKLLVAVALVTLAFALLM